jgi:uncharacterized Tic20 family protein
MQSMLNLLAVLACAVGVACVIGALYAWGLRLWAAGAVDEQGNAHIGARVGSVICFSLCIALVLFALWLTIPAFH